MSLEQLQWVFLGVLSMITWFSASLVLQYQEKEESWTRRSGAAMQKVATTIMSLPGVILLAFVSAIVSFFYTGVEAIEGSQS